MMRREVWRGVWRGVDCSVACGVAWHRDAQPHRHSTPPYTAHKHTQRVHAHTPCAHNPFLTNPPPSSRRLSRFLTSGFSGGGGGGPGSGSGATATGGSDDAAEAERRRQFFLPAFERLVALIRGRVREPEGYNSWSKDEKHEFRTARDEVGDWVGVGGWGLGDGFWGVGLGDGFLGGGRMGWGWGLGPCIYIHASARPPAPSTRTRPAHMRTHTRTRTHAHPHPRPPQVGDTLDDSSAVLGFGRCLSLLVEPLAALGRADGGGGGGGGGSSYDWRTAEAALFCIK